MGQYALRALLSMIRSSKRMAGRSWKTEWMRRTLHLFFEQAASRPGAWSRTQFDHLPVSKKLLQKVSVRSVNVAHVDCLEITPTDVSRSMLIVYLHGGAYVTGTPRGYLGLMAQIAVACNARIIAPDYRLSFEAPFPAAQDDSLSVVQALRKDMDEARLILMGDSAGGALALSTALSLSKQDYGAKPDALALMSPWVEPTAEVGTMLSNAKNDIFSKELLDESYAAHVQNADPYNTRVNFINADLTALPTTYIQSGAGELFHDQISDFVNRANAQGAQVKWDAFATQFHVFQAMSPQLSDAKQAIAMIADFCASVSGTATA